MLETIYKVLIVSLVTFTILISYYFMIYKVDKEYKKLCDSFNEKVLNYIEKYSDIENYNLAFDDINIIFKELNLLSKQLHKRARTVNEIKLVMKSSDYYLSLIDVCRKELNLT